MFDRLKRMFKSGKNFPFAVGKLPRLFSSEQVSRMGNNTFASNFFVYASKFVTQLVGEAWEPYFVNRNNEEVDDERSQQLLAVLDNPFMAYTGTDFIQQFALQRKYYDLCLVKVDAEIVTNSLQQQIISGSSIQEISVKDDGRVVRVSQMEGQDMLIYLDRPAANGENTGALSVSQSNLDGWDSASIPVNSLARRMQLMIDTEIALQSGGFAAATEISSPRNAYIFEDHKSEADFRDYLQESSGKVINSMTMVGGDIKRLTKDANVQDIISFSEFAKKTILEGFGINKAVLEITSASSKVLYEAVIRNMYASVVDPELQAYVDLFNRDIQNIYPIAGDLRLQFRDTYPENIDFLTERMQALVSSDIFTINEAREAFDKEEIEGGDVLRREMGTFI